MIIRGYSPLPSMILIIDTQTLFTSSFQGDKPFKAYQQVIEERPLAVVQILLAIFAVEALGQFNQVKDGAAPGDLGFDPLNLKPTDPETWEKVQVHALPLTKLRSLDALYPHPHIVVINSCMAICRKYLTSIVFTVIIRISISFVS